MNEKNETEFVDGESRSMHYCGKLVVHYIDQSQHTIKDVYLDTIDVFDSEELNIYDEDLNLIDVIPLEQVIALSDQGEYSSFGILFNPDYDVSFQFSVMTHKQRMSESESKIKEVGAGEVPLGKGFYVKDLISLYGGNAKKALEAFNGKLGVGDTTYNFTTFESYLQTGYLHEDLSKFLIKRTLQGCYFFEEDSYTEKKDILNKHWLKRYMEV